MSRLSQWCFQLITPRLRCFSTIGSGPVWGRQELPWLVDIERMHGSIMAEMQAYLAAGNRLPDKSDLDPNHAVYGRERWELLHLQVCGEPIASVVRHFPVTMATLARVPGLCTAMFSRLPPERSYIPRHRDGESGTLRMHLGLKVPDQGRCYIRIADQDLSWQVGRAFVMDVGANEHEVLKDAEQERIILIVDFLRPLPRTVAWISWWLYRWHVGKAARAMLRDSYRKLEGIS